MLGDHIAVTVHLKANDNLSVKPHKGLRSEAILELSDCDVFLTKDHLVRLKTVIEEHLGEKNHL